MSMDIKKAFSRLAKSVCILTAEQGGEQYASAATAVCNVSDSPPSLLVCMEQKASMSRVLACGGGFAVNVLGGDGGEVLNTVVSNSGSDRFLEGAWANNTEGLPTLNAAQVVFECVVVEIIPHQTHNIVIAEIVVARTADEASTMIYFAGDFQSLSAA